EYSFCPVSSLSHRMEEINELFAGDRASVIRLQLEQGSKWAKHQATKMAAKSPRSTTIALRQIRTGRYLSSVQDALRLEYRIATRLVGCDDFHEGVRARIVDKDNYPMWQPNSLKRIGQDDVAKYFLPLTSGELEFLEL
ncbi:MAG: enoyl-CoA hydratase/isomerase family protein, partial [Pseudomonadota bacterium]